MKDFMTLHYGEHGIHCCSPQTKSQDISTSTALILATIFLVPQLYEWSKLLLLHPKTQQRFAMNNDLEQLYTLSAYSQVGFLAFCNLLLGNGVESLICTLLSWTMDGVGVHLVNIRREVWPGEESLTHPPVPRDRGSKHQGQLLLEKKIRRIVRNTYHLKQESLSKILLMSAYHKCLADSWEQQYQVLSMSKIKTRRSCLIVVLWQTCSHRHIQQLISVLTGKAPPPGNFL